MRPRERAAIGWRLCAPRAIHARPKCGFATRSASCGSRIDFYASARAMLRAKLAIWHLKDEHRPDAEQWRARTMRYPYIAADHAAKFG
jgi:hypothetical protein